MLPKKLSGIYEHRVKNRKTPLVRGFDDIFKIPHSRYTESDNDAIRNDERLIVMAESETAGIFLCMSVDGRQIFVMGHPEYDRMTLDKEYKRDLGKGIDPEIPKDYYPDNDPTKEPILSWRGHANTLYTNWVNYYVYQVTPYEIHDIS